MGGVDKGLVPLRGRPLVAHVLDALQPQVGTLMISANRHLDDYRSLGHPAWPDDLPDYPGPLAGLVTGLAHCGTPWLVSAPCDTPTLPPDLVARLAAAATREGAAIAMAATSDAGARDATGRAGAGQWRSQPVFALVQASLLESLRAFLADGGRKVGHWMGEQGRVLVPFDEAELRGANTRDELERL